MAEKKRPFLSFARKTVLASLVNRLSFLANVNMTVVEVKATVVKRQKSMTGIAKRAVGWTLKMRKIMPPREERMMRIMVRRNLGTM